MNQSRRRGMAALAALAGGLPWPQGACAQTGHAPTAEPQTRALLVGVGPVAALPRRLWLRGPDNDVQLMRQVLLERGVAAAAITSLSGPTTATHARVSAAMQALLERTREGDQVVLHLAGHGVQVPQRMPLKPGVARELDGLDEVFLCADTQAWNAQQGALPRGLYDDDIGDWMDALVARGARVLAIFDTCHASGLHRDRHGSTRLRGIAAAELGVPQSAAMPAHRPAPRTPPDTRGRVLAFAARSHEGTPEEWLPKGSPQAQVHGVFTYAVVQALRDGVVDAAALRESVAAQYGNAYRASPVPSVLGTGGWAVHRTAPTA